MNTTNYKSFSARHGYEQPKPIQHESMDKDLRNGLWNVFYQCFPDSRDQQTKLLYLHAVFKSILMKFLKHPSDEYEGFAEPGTKGFVKNIFLSSEWHEVLSLIEFIIGDFGSYDRGRRGDFIDLCNQMLKEENSAYKIVDDFVVEITSEQEIESIETAMETPHQNVNKHINNALAIFSRRENPDYQNSIKESILAVEAIAQEITGKQKSLNALTQSLPIHSHFQAGLTELYNWTSTDGGMRHASSDKTLPPSKNTARFMLVTCSAFVNYIISEKDS